MDKISAVTDEEWNEVNKWNREITEEFLQQGQLSDHTLKQYKSTLQIFFRWVKDNCDNKPLYELKPRDALKYQNFLMSKNLSSSAIKLKRSAVSSLCGYVELYYLDEYPMFRNIYNKKIPNAPKAFKNEKKPLTPEEYELLINTLKKQERWQMVAYAEFTYSSGCRKGEARQLLKEVINYEKVEGKNFYLTHNIRCKGAGKIGKIRKLNFDDKAIDAIRFWLQIRGEDDCPYVFVSKVKGKYQQVSETTFNGWCSDLFSKIVGRRVHPHQFREQRATDLVLRDGKDIKAAQALLGHKDSSTTEIYVIRETENDVDDAF